MQQTEAGQRQLPAYKSHKTVRALKIASIEQTPADEPAAIAGGTWRLIPEDKSYDPITVSHSFVLKHNPQPGGYYVLYADGYASFSPEQAFEEGYAPVMAMSQEESASLSRPDGIGEIGVAVKKEECFTAIGPEEHRRNWVGDPPAGGFENYVKNHGQPLRAHVTASSGDRDTEQAIRSVGADRAPRVTPADIEANIASEHYFTAANGIAGAIGGDSSLAGLNALRQTPPPPESLGLLTFCVLVLRNGTKIVGINYGAIDPAQHDAERGRREAREDAVRQVWPLLGYELRSRLSMTDMDYRMLFKQIPMNVIAEMCADDNALLGLIEAAKN